MSARLDRLLRPKTIAVIGGGAWCKNVIAQCKAMEFSGDIWSVHPSREDFGGVPTFATIADLPCAPDAAFIGVNRATTINVTRELAARGAGGAVCFAAGFAEAAAEAGDGNDLQAQLVEAAADMPILGPNCYGFINYLDGALLWPDQHGGLRAKTGVAIITQSSNIAINMTMQARALPLAYVITAGNQAQTGLHEIGKAVLADPRVTALGLHIEGIGDLAGFQALARRAEALGKSIVALKVGASAAAQDATISHTASLAGSQVGARAMFAHLGVADVGSIADFLETLKVLHVTGPLSSGRIASLSCSGGEASLMADLAEPQGLEFPPLSATQTDGLRAALGPMVRLSNPLDYNTYIWPDIGKMAATFTAMMQGDLALGIVVLDFPRTPRCDDAEWAHVVDAVSLTATATGKPMAILASLPETLPEHWAQIMIERGILPLAGMSEGLAAVAAAARLGVPRAPQADLARPRIAEQTRMLDEAASKALFGTAGITCPRSIIAATPAQCGQAADELGGAVVLKGVGFAHKSDAGAVVLGLTGGASVQEAAQKIGAAGFLVEEMVTGGVAEMLVGITTDPAHGMLLTLGAGGVLTEVLADTQTLSVPATRTNILAAIGRLAIARVLAGYRGAPAGNIQAIADAALALQTLAMDAGLGIIEAEINPLIVTPKTAIAADALIRTEISK